jgi:uncharacterized protein YtpQ (UPF0354 family)
MREHAMVVRLCGAFIIVAAMCGSARAQNVPKGEAAFTEYVATQLRRAIEGEAVKVEGPLTIGIGGIQANLDRIFAFCNRNTSGCAKEISNYVGGVAQILKDRTAPPSKEAVRIVVRTKAYLAAALAARPKDPPKLQPRALAGDLVMLPAIDMPRTIKILDEKDNVALGLSADDVFQLGLANLRKHLKPLMSIAKVTQAGQIGQLSSDAYHSSRLALLETWAPLAKAHGGKLIVAAPATDSVIYIGDDAPTAIEAFRLLAKNVSTRAPTPLSTELLRWTPTRWEVVR